jgi:hypothetical protein
LNARESPAKLTVMNAKKALSRGRKKTVKSSRGKPQLSNLVTEFTNIRVLPSGYQVSVTRARIEFSKHFAGHSDASLKAATRFRDKVLRELPPKRINPVPRKVLSALGLDREVVGVYRHVTPPFYQVSFREKGKWHMRSFSWNKRDEAEAYAAAVAFREELVRQSKR